MTLVAGFDSSTQSVKIVVCDLETGSIVRSGVIRRNSKARLLRDGVVVADNLTVESLRRFKDDATEVREGFECGIGLGSFNDIKIDDVIETFELREKPRV